MPPAHTLLLVQRTADAASRCWTSHDSLSIAVQHLMGIYAAGIAKRTPAADIGVEDVLAFLERLFDVVALVYDAEKAAYVAKDIDWLKDRIQAHWNREPLGE